MSLVSEIAGSCGCLYFRYSGKSSGERIRLDGIERLGLSPAETLGDLLRRRRRCRPPSMVDGLRQPSIRGRLIPSASRAQPISHSSRAALHISQTCLRCRQSNANTALILELKPPSFATPSAATSARLPYPQPPRPVRGLLNHYGK